MTQAARYIAVPKQLSLSNATEITNRLQSPYELEPWLEAEKHGLKTISKNKAKNVIKHLLKAFPWQWPEERIVFITDLHADGDALLHSLLLSGSIKFKKKELTNTTNKKNTSKKTKLKKVPQFKLTEQGKQSLFIIGGDCFDKGPSNLYLMDVLKNLIDIGANVEILAGNHDLRVLYGMRCAGQTKDPCNGHFFIRMGAKALPFLVEIRDRYLTGKKALKHIPDEQTCLKLLMPQDSWWEGFPEFASWVMPQQTIEREMHKIRKKSDRFTHLCKEVGLSMREAYAAALYWQKLFITPKGEYAWFFKKINLTTQKGSLLFIHAGLDDRVAAMIQHYGIPYINQQFKQQLHGNPFEFYYGPLANTIRTKYRYVDMPLTRKGARQIHKAGIHALFHGHINLYHGQRITLRKSLLNFECDITLDAGSREREEVSGLGAGATIIHPDGYVLGISSDYDKVKVLDPIHLSSSSH